MTRPITLGWLLCLSALVSGGCLSPARPGLSELVTPIKTGPSPEGRQAELPPHKAAEACLVTAQMLEKHGHEVEAIAEYELARSYNPKLQVSRRLAVLYDRQCDYARAMHEYRQALKQSPKDVELLNDVGYCCYERGDWAEAEKYLRQAVQLNPSYKRAWVNLGLVLGQQERYDESYQAFAQVLTPAEARSNVGVILMQHGKFEEAK
ncbi:MAG: tetratricopeptide repeat protein, partial [Gemmataceae bacterium]|nr:tetratricopeptide repeat protein [Gemmataceae bacterium]